EELGDDSSSSSPAISNSESLAKLIQSEAAKLREELCSKHGVCDNSMELLMQNHLRLPTIVPEDGCFLSGFRKEKCLHKIHHDLVEFQTYFLYLEETFTSEKNLVESIRYSARSLAGTVKMMMKRPNALSDRRQTQKVSLADLQSEDLWIQKVTSRLILHSFIDFMQKTARAVRFVGTFHISGISVIKLNKI
ncbi:hypothetical protein FKM82_006921, partial [Ascaphus truei]